MQDYTTMTREQLLEKIEEVKKRIEICEGELQGLEAQNVRYREMLDDEVMIGCFETDRKGSFTFFNRRNYEALGLSREQYLEKGPTFASETDLVRMRETLKAVKKSGRPSMVEYRLRHRDGSIRIIETEITLIRDKAGDPIGYRGVSRDTTERKNLISELQRYKDFVENVEDICFETDLNGTVTFVNEKAARWLGYSSRRDVVGKNYRDYSATPEQVRKIKETFQEVFRTGESRATDYDLLDADQRITHIHQSVALIRDSKGNPRGFRGIAQDISERRKLELEQERYRYFLESVEDGCYELDLGGYHTFCNQATERIMGYTREELSKINHDVFTKPEQLQEIRSILSEVRRTGKPAGPYLQEVIRKDGETGCLMVSTSLIRDAEGNPVGFRGIFHDVTEHRKLEEKERKLTEQLHQAQKMEAIETLAGGIAHDFNNLLMGIQGYASLMLLDISPGHPHFERLKAVESLVQSGADLTRQLLGYARGVATRSKRSISTR